MQSNVGQTQIPQSANVQTNPISAQPVQSGPSVTPPPVQAPMPQGGTNPNNVQVPNYSGVNIQIFNPSVATPGSSNSYNVNAPSYGQQQQPYYGPGYYMNNYNQQPAKPEEPKTPERKTEKKDVVALTDDYIKNLESYLNSKDKAIRSQAAKQVIDRLTEDPKRKDDPALNILVDKMLQDPSQEIRIIALSALDSRLATGDQYAVQILKNMQNSKSGYGDDALQASNILLKMSGKTITTDVEVPPDKKKAQPQQQAKIQEAPKQPEQAK
ncbi:MAG: hypothetical protein LKG27_05310 [Clostridiaceae bacterium]|jgi:hypothetical protein|nr:hypothetical protein [Clostridiaceae bacterium]